MDGRDKAHELGEAHNGPRRAEELSTLGSLTAVKTLSLSNNKLTTLPEDICLIKGLRSLAVHGNKLHELHSSIGQLIHAREARPSFEPALVPSNLDRLSSRT